MCGSQNELKSHYMVLDMLHFSSKVICYKGIISPSPAKAHCLIPSHYSLPWRWPLTLFKSRPTPFPVTIPCFWKLPVCVRPISHSHWKPMSFTFKCVRGSLPSLCSPLCKISILMSVIHCQNPQITMATFVCSQPTKVFYFYCIFEILQLHNCNTVSKTLSTRFLFKSKAKKKLTQLWHCNVVC